MTINEENFIEDFSNLLKRYNVEMVYLEDDGYALKGPDIFLDIEDIYEEL